MKPEIRMVVVAGLTHGAAVLTGAAIAVTVAYHAPSRAQTLPAAAQTAHRHDSRPAAQVAAGRPDDTMTDEDVNANAFDPITGQVIDTRSEAGYREWLKREAAKARY